MHGNIAVAPNNTNNRVLRSIFEMSRRQIYLLTFVSFVLLDKVYLMLRMDTKRIK